MLLTFLHYFTTHDIINYILIISYSFLHSHVYTIKNKGKNIQNDFFGNISLPPPPPSSKIVLIFVKITALTIMIQVGIAVKIIHNMA